MPLRCVSEQVRAFGSRWAKHGAELVLFDQIRNERCEVAIARDDYGSIIFIDFVDGVQRQIDIDIPLGFAVAIPCDLLELQHETRALEIRVKLLLLGHVSDKVIRFNDLQSVAQVNPESTKVERNTNLSKPEMKVLPVDESKIFCRANRHCGQAYRLSAQAS
jgi:hypothetical protein